VHDGKAPIEAAANIAGRLADIGDGYLFARYEHLAQTGVELASFSIAARAANARILARLETASNNAPIMVLSCRLLSPESCASVTAIGAQSTPTT
jgi:hypothetical protein